MRRLLPILLLMLLLAGLPARPAQAGAPPALTMAVEPAFGGRFKYGEWLPVFVTLENPGADLAAEIQVSVSNQSGQLYFVIPAELPAGARKRFAVYVLPNNFSRTVRVDLVQAERTLLSEQAGVSVVPNDRYVIGLIGTHAAGMLAMNPPQLPGRRDRAEAVALALNELPDRPEGLRLLNALVLNDVDTGRLSPAQIQALSGWVVGGGRLVLGGGTGAERTLAGLPVGLQPVALQGQQEVMAVPALAAYAGEPVRVPGPFLLAHARPDPAARVLLSQEMAGSSLPLLVERPVGNGFVDFVALDLAGAPFDAWTGTTPFAHQLLSPGAAWPDYLPPDVAPAQMSDSQMTYTLSNLPALDLPSLRLLGLLLAGYILLVGPANYLLLRRLDRLAWAWITVPALTLVFSALAYGFSFRLRGSDIIVNQVSIMEMGQDGRLNSVRTYAGIFSPNRQAYEVEVSGRPLIRPLGEAYDPWSGSVNTSGVMRVVQAEPSRVQGLIVNQWSMQSFVAESAPTGPPGLVARLTAGRDRIQGQLINTGTATWQDVIVVFNGAFQKLGDLPPGQAADIHLELSRNGDMVMGFGSYILFQDELNRPGGAGRETSFKQSVLDGAVFNNNAARQAGAPLLLAWQKDSPLQVRLPGRAINNQKTTLLYGWLPISFDSPRVGIPPGFSLVETLATSGDAGLCNYGLGTVGYHLYQGAVELRLALPAAVQNVRPERLDLSIRTDGGWPSLPAIELYDWEAGQWVHLEEARPGLNPIEDRARFYDPASASVRLRVSSANAVQGGGCLFFDLALEGSRL